MGLNAAIRIAVCLALWYLCHGASAPAQTPGQSQTPLSMPEDGTVAAPDSASDRQWADSGKSGVQNFFPTEMTSGPVCKAQETLVKIGPVGARPIPFTRYQERFGWVFGAVLNLDVTHGRSRRVGWARTVASYAEHEEEAAASASVRAHLAEDQRAPPRRWVGSLRGGVVHGRHSGVRHRLRGGSASLSR